MYSSIVIGGRYGLSSKDFERLDVTAETISRCERRAMEAERETVDRYVAAYLSAHVGEIVDARITGVQNFGFFATVESIGGDGLVPVSTLGTERFHYDEARQAFQNVITLYQNDPVVLESFVQVANCWRRLDQPAMARGNLERAKVVLGKLPADADFLASTNFNRQQWSLLLDEMGKW